MPSVENSRKSGEVPERPMLHGKWSQRISLIIVFAIFLGALGLVGFRWTRQRPSKLQIVANLSTAGTIKSLRGRVLLEGKPVQGAQVSTVLIYGRGNKESPKVAITDSDGGFVCDSIPAYLDNNAIAEVIVHASREYTKPDSSKVVKSGDEFLKVTGQGTLKIISLDLWTVIVLPVIFLISFLVPFLPLNPRWKYGISLGSAILFTIAMIAAISIGLYNVNANYSSDSNDVLSLGFANIFQGKYAANTNPEWIFSFTSRTIFPDSVAYGDQVMSGFGVPLWVLLIAVVGAGLLTVSIIVSEIKTRPKFYLIEQALNNNAAIAPKTPEARELSEFRGRLERIIRHQFNILFSPIGAIFVYQLLVIADAAVNSVTVALAAFGAGASLNLILDRAISYAENAIKIK